jgi:hypothetical protein
MIIMMVVMIGGSNYHYTYDCFLIKYLYGIRNTEYESGIRNTEYGIRNTEYGIRNTEYINIYIYIYVKIYCI